MSKTRFWATIALAALLGVFGFILGGFLPLPSPYTEMQTRILFALFGSLVGLLTYAQIAAWVVRMGTRLIKHIITYLASEVVEQITRATSRGRQVKLASGQIKLAGRQVRLASGQILPFSEEKTPSLEEFQSEAVILDTSSIIDGRILEVAQAGFLYGKVLVPEFVLRELQQVADSADNLKRARGRRGFEVVNHLKKIRDIKLQVLDEQSVALPAQKVDDKLISLGKKLKGKIVTSDFNLASVAKLQGLRVLNINELANALKTLPVPGETFKVKIVQVGKDKDQGVGYLSDGTMVVVKDGASGIGKDLEVEVTKVLQGSSGRMVFGRIKISRD